MNYFCETSGRHRLDMLLDQSLEPALVSDNCPEIFARRAYPFFTYTRNERIDRTSIFCSWRFLVAFGTVHHPGTAL